MADIEKATKALQDYMNTYDKQFGYKEYSEECFINDVLYGLGIALDPEKYRYAGGFDLFKRKLSEFIKENRWCPLTTS